MRCSVYLYDILRCIAYRLSYTICPGDSVGAEEALRKAIALHPWAGHVPTVLWTILLERESELQGRFDGDKDGDGDETGEGSGDGDGDSDKAGRRVEVGITATGTATGTATPTATVTTHSHTHSQPHLHSQTQPQTHMQTQVRASGGGCGSAGAGGDIVKVVAPGGFVGTIMMAHITRMSQLQFSFLKK